MTHERHCWRRFLYVAGGLSCALLLQFWSFASGTEAGTNALPRQIGPGLYAMGKVTIEQARRQVRFPIAVNQRTGVVEYAVVTATGKTYESVFRTEAQPRDINVGLLLLGARPAATNFSYPPGDWPIPGEKVSVNVNWRNGEQEIRYPLEHFIVTINNSQPLRAGPWIYNGSYLENRTFIAQRDGSIVTIQTDPTALINNSRPERTNDDLHYVNSPAMPPEKTRLELTIGFYQPDASTNTMTPAITNRYEGAITPVTPPVVSPPSTREQRSP